MWLGGEPNIRGKVKIGGEDIETVTSNEYLGSLIEDKIVPVNQGRCLILRLVRAANATSWHCCKRSTTKRKRRQESDSEDEESRDPDSPKKLTATQQRMLYNRVQAENSCLVRSRVV